MVARQKSEMVIIRRIIIGNIVILIKTICVSNAFFIFVVSSLEIVLWSPEIRSIFLTTASSIFGVSIPAGLCNRLVIDHDGLLSKSRIASFDRLLVIDIFEKWFEDLWLWI